MNTHRDERIESMPIVSASIYRLSQPLKEPYYLAFGTFDSFDTFLAEVQTEDGRSAWGETTACPGYVPETGDEIWDFLRTHAPGLVGSAPGDQITRLTPLAQRHPFASTPLLTALEGVACESVGASAPQGGEATTVPLVGILSGKDERSLETSFWGQIERGHRTVKLKVGFDVESDITRAALLQGLARQARGVRVRVDANQGYSLEDARRFVDGLDPEVVELFEQPFGIGDWDSQVALAPSSPVPLMMDESIHGIEEVERVAALRCADYVKFKLMKSGSRRLLAEQIALAQRQGLKVVLGNGVAGEIGCYHEALAGLQAGLEAAGEMNGFLKIRRSVLPEPIISKDGGIVVVPGFDPKPSADHIAEMAIDRQRWA